MVIISDDHQISEASGQLDRQGELSFVRVLELIDTNEQEPVLILRKDIRILPEQRHRLDDHIVEIHGIGRSQPLLIFLIDQPNLFEPIVFSNRIQIFQRVDQTVLGMTDLAENGFALQHGLVEIQILDHSRNGFFGIFLVVDHEILSISEQFGMSAQDPAANGMERSRPNVRRPRVFADPVGQTRFHLVRGFVRKGNTQNAPGRTGIDGHGSQDRLDLLIRKRGRILQGVHVGLTEIFRDMIACISVAKADHMRDPVDQDGRLPASCARQDQKRVKQRINCFPLRLIQKPIVVVKQLFFGPDIFFLQSRHLLFPLSDILLIHYIKFQAPAQGENRILTQKGDPFVRGLPESY